MKRRELLATVGAISATTNLRWPATARAAETGFVDARSDPVSQELQAQTCIIGAGAAGITLARALAAAGHPVLLVESGGRDIEGETQALCLGTSSGLPYFDLAACRLRYFGGTTNHWAGYCRANDPIDYAARTELGLPGWPLDPQTLTPYISRAAGMLGIDTAFFDPGAQLAARGVTNTGLIEHNAPELETKTFQFARNIRFGPRFRAELAHDPRVRVIEHLNIVEIVLNEAGTAVDHCIGRTLNGREFRIKAHRFVLAAHAIENARLLLASDARSAAGIGNAGDHVGRHFMDHVHVTASRFQPGPGFPRLYDRRFLERRQLNANLSLAEATMRGRGVLNYYCRFNPVTADPEALQARARLRRRFWEPASTGLFSDAATLVSNPRAVFAREDSAPAWFDLDHRIEQAPNPLSRVSLGSQRDRLGMRMVHLHWALSDLDVKTLAIGQQVIAATLERLGLGRCALETIDLALIEQRALGHYHQIGTTRMSSGPRDGVVDANLKVHGVANLFIAGSSVFPRAGYSGPTMMLIALALRLADHLAQQ